jgi:pimeloyl-ACP methyl ester carboxylesterase
MAETLDPSGADRRLDELVLRTPGYEGAATLIHGAGVPEGMRAATAADELLRPTFERAGLVVQYEVVLDELTSVATATIGTVRSGAGEPGIELELPEVAEGWEQMVLATDASGIATWHFALPSPAAAPVLRGTRRRTYRVRAIHTPPPPAAGEATVRGVLGGIGHALIRVLAFKLIDPLLGEVGEYFAARWEAQYRPYRVRTFAPDDYTSAEASTFAPADWDGLRGARALLFLHGTFSRAHTAFSGLPLDALLTLHSRYEGRIFAFDHYTLSDNPRRNVEQLLSQIPVGCAPLELDVVCHSRGGLVARCLAERSELAIERVVFVGTPNAGTVLADFDHLGDLLDAYTTLLSFVPDVGITDVLETLIALAKSLAVGALKGLEGLVSMTPRGTFLDHLNATASASAGAGYFALASDYEPVNPALREWARNRLTDSLFEHAANDLVVPTDGVYSANGAVGFPIADRHVFGRTDGVAHSDYFTSAIGAGKLLEWLTG